MRLFIMFLIFFFCGCESTQLPFSQQSISSPEQLYMDEEFEPETPFNLISQEDIFAIDHHMKTLMSHKVKNQKGLENKSKALLSQIFNRSANSLQYDSHANTTATQTFYKRKANCLSLTIMAYALAKEANLNVKFQDVIVPEYWINNGDYSLLAGHVNLLVTSDYSVEQSDGWGKELFEIDFAANESMRKLPRKTINKNTMTAMFYNNKAAQYMVDGNYKLAYAYLKKSTELSPEFSPTWANLGILYHRSDYDDMAKKAYIYAMQLDNGNYSAMTNLANILKSTNDIEEFDVLQEVLQKKRNTNPFYFAMLADRALLRSDIDEAMKNYKKAIRLNENMHEFYYGLAKVYAQQNRYEKAISYVNKARSKNNFKHVDTLYQNKISWLRNANLNE